MRNIKKYLIILPILAVLAVPAVSSADTIADLQAQINALLTQVQQLQAQLAQLQGQPTAWCYDFNRDLKYGNGGTDVYNLQIALEKEGFSITQDEKNQKNFGESTADTVSGFQQKYKDEILTPLGLKYGTGYVGEKTRAKLNSLYGCGIKPPIECAYPCPQFSTPAPCELGYKQVCKQVNPDVCGCYLPPVCKCIPITETNQPPTIHSVSGPTALKVNETGTWTIKANDPEQGVLTYSVVWGDETAGVLPTVAPQSAAYVQTATFTRSYSNSGIYNSTFTVTDDKGLSAKTSISVNVGQIACPLYSQPLCKEGEKIVCPATTGTGACPGPCQCASSITVLSPNGGETYIQGSTINITWQTKNLPTNTTYVHLVLDKPIDVGQQFTKQVAVNCNGKYVNPLYNSVNNYVWDGKTVCLSDGLQTYTIPTGSYKIIATLYSWPNTNNPGIEIASDSSDAAFSIVAAGTSPILSVAPDATFPTTNILAGSSNAEVGRFLLSSNNVSDVKIASIYVKRNNIGSCAFQNLKLYSGTTQIGSTITALDTNCGALFNLSLTVPKSTTQIISLKVDVPASMKADILAFQIAGISGDPINVIWSGIPATSNAINIVTSLPVSVGEKGKLYGSAVIKWNTTNGTSSYCKGPIPSDGTNYGGALNDSIYCGTDNIPKCKSGFRRVMMGTVDISSTEQEKYFTCESMEGSTPTYDTGELFGAAVIKINQSGVYYCAGPKPSDGTNYQGALNDPIYCGTDNIPKCKSGFRRVMTGTIKVSATEEEKTFTCEVMEQQGLPRSLYQKGELMGAAATKWNINTGTSSYCAGPKPSDGTSYGGVLNSWISCGSDNIPRCVSGFRRVLMGIMNVSDTEQEKYFTCEAMGNETQGPLGGLSITNQMASVLDSARTILNQMLEFLKGR